MAELGKCTGETTFKILVSMDVDFRQKMLDIGIIKKNAKLLIIM